MSNLEIRLPLLQSDDLNNQIWGNVLKTQVLESALAGTVGMKDKELRKMHTAADKHLLELIQVPQVAHAASTNSLFFGFD